MSNAPLLQEHESPPHLSEYLNVLRKHAWTIIAICVVTVTLTIIWNFKATPIYRAGAQILIETTDPKVVTFEKVSGRDLQFAEYYATQYKLLQSRALARRVVEALKLAQRPGFGLPRPGEESHFSQLLHAVTGFVRSLVEGTKAREEGPSPKIFRTPEESAVHVLLDRVVVQPVRLTRLVNVFFEDPDPVLAAQVTNTLSELYLKMNLEFRFTTTREASAWLAKEAEEVRTKLITAERSLQDYKEKHNLVSLEDRRDIVTQKLGELNTEATRARTTRIGLEVLARRLRNGNDSSALTSLPDVMENPLIQKLKGEFVTLQNEYSALTKRYKDQHPQLLRLRSRLTQIEKKINDETRQVANSILTRYQVALAREKSLVQSLEEQKQEAQRINRLSIQYDNLKREAETNRKIYEDMLKRTKETGLLEGLHTSNIRIVDRAEVPKSPDRPRRSQNILIAMVASLFFGVAFVFLLDHLDTRIRRPEEAEAIVGAPMLGVIPDLGRKVERQNGMLGMDGDSGLIIRECLRQIRAMAVFRLKEMKVIQLTSCIPAEGKSFIAAHLALALSQTGKRVLLMDGDFHRAGLDRWFQSRRMPGLIQVLLGEVAPAEAVRSFGRASALSFVSAGRMKGTSPRMFEASNLRPVIDELKGSYDYVLIDSPPILAVSDPLIWSECVDGVIFIVDVQQVNPDMLSQAVGKLRELEVPIPGLILNRMTKRHNYYYYGYSRKYGYDSKAAARRED